MAATEHYTVTRSVKDPNVIRVTFKHIHFSLRENDVTIEAGACHGFFSSSRKKKVHVSTLDPKVRRLRSALTKGDMIKVVKRIKFYRGHDMDVTLRNPAHQPSVLAVIDKELPHMPVPR